MKRRFLAVLICLAMLATLLPTAALAAEKDAIQFGMGGIGENGRLCFGKYTRDITSSTETILWRVLNMDAAAKEAYLLAGGAFPSSPFREKGSLGGYDGSALQSAINAIYDGLDSREQSIVKKTTVIEGSAHEINGEKISARLFPLSFKEASKIGWGSSLLNCNEKWWLINDNRLRGEANYVDAEGWGTDRSDAETPLTENTTERLGVRPACYLDTSTVLFSSNAGAKAAAGMEGGIAPVPAAAADADWSLTLTDSESGSFAIATEDMTWSQAKVAYSGAKTGANEYISAVITDDYNEKIYYYGRVKRLPNEEDSYGVVTIDIPALPDNLMIGGGAQLRLFNEQYNGNYKTDYASELKTVEYPIITIQPETLANGKNGEAYNATLTTMSDMMVMSENVTYSLLSGELPTGLALTTNLDGTGSISGTPTKGGTYRFTIGTEYADTWEGETYRSYGQRSYTVAIKAPVTGVKLDKQTAEICSIEGTSREKAAYAEVQLTATVSPEDATDKGVTWVSSDKIVATVDENGLVKGENYGVAVITVITNDGGFAAACTVTVKSYVAVTRVELDRTTAKLLAGGEPLTLTATVLPENATDKSLVWRSNNERVATVDASGVVTAIKAGAAVITVTTTDGGYTASCIVTVTTPVTGVTLDKSEAEMTIDDEPLALTATVLPEEATDKSVAWSSSDESIATVDENGVVTALAVGEVTITVTTNDGGHTASCVVMVKEPLTDGWQQIDRKWYFGRNGLALTGLQELEGYQRGSQSGLNTYFFDENGAMQTGFFSAKQLGKSGADWYFFYEMGWSPLTSTLGQMLKNYYVERPSQGYLSESEKKVIEEGKDRKYRYYFDAEGKMFTGWCRNNFSFDQTGHWRYFGEYGASPTSSRLGRMCCYGMQFAVGNNNELHVYMFTKTGGMLTGTVTFNGETRNFTDLPGNPSPATTLNGAMITE